ncbi:hypothetical protein [Paraclostridium sordellii]|uniref:hypothetical protein n=1 Tax=Paraclostridium sordellii TaxID=1505 RepID=UPI0005DFF90B|nr:hypothetical protein [Paeniclostridium sordellii]CEO21897.1 Uncharacterised protein [[Clostridium] sordellii] [Paeniclostridium sordellii]
MFTEVKDKLKSLGISRRYINSLDWMVLLEEITEGMDINFERLKQKHSSRDQINMEELASDLEDIYYDKLPDELIEKGKNKTYYYRKKISDIISRYLTQKRNFILK